MFEVHSAESLKPARALAVRPSSESRFLWTVIFLLVVSFGYLNTDFWGSGNATLLSSVRMDGLVGAEPTELENHRCNNQICNNQVNSNAGDREGLIPAEIDCEHWESVCHEEAGPGGSRICYKLYKNDYVNCQPNGGKGYTCWYEETEQCAKLAITHPDPEDGCSEARCNSTSPADRFPCGKTMEDCESSPN